MYEIKDLIPSKNDMKGFMGFFESETEFPSDAEIYDYLNHVEFNTEPPMNPNFGSEKESGQNEYFYLEPDTSVGQEQIL